MWMWVSLTTLASVTVSERHRGHQTAQPSPSPSSALLYPGRTRFFAGYLGWWLSRGKYNILCESRGQWALNVGVLLLVTGYLTCACCRFLYGLGQGLGAGSGIRGWVRVRVNVYIYMWRCKRWGLWLPLFPLIIRYTGNWVSLFRSYLWQCVTHIAPHPKPPAVSVYTWCGGATSIVGGWLLPLSMTPGRCPTWQGLTWQHPAGECGG